ncbi:MAG: FGGY-family carbohydrate kinase [Thermaerobacter sp.]|nr:FGGY-family carbohydrate kinase [Thermaerobacter sp.]
MGKPCIFAIDLGTSACKVALVGTDGAVLALETEEYPLALLPGGGAEQDPDAWWRAIATAAARLWQTGAAAPGDVKGIGCTAQWSGTVPVDNRGRALSPAIIWMDARGARHVQAATRGWPSVAGYGAGKLFTWLRKTGGIPAGSGKDSIAHILYLRAERPELYAAAACFLEPKDYLNARLTGRLAATVDSIALHWVTDNRDAARVRYDAGLLRAVGVERSKLPEILRSTDIVGELCEEAARDLSLPAGVPVAGGSPDIQSAAVGSGATQDFQAHLYLGTSSWLTCHVPLKKTDIAHNMATLPSAIPGRYFVANEQETAGACLTFLRDNLFYHEDVLGTGPPPKDAYRLFDEAAALAPPGAGGVLFTPWLYGERTPIEDHLVRGGFYNVSLETSRPHLVRAVLEGVALNSRWLLQAMDGFTGRRLDPIRCIGGGARSDVWCQIQADVLGRTIEQVDEPLQANVRGAATIAAVALGLSSFEEAAQRIGVAKTFEPRAETRAVYDRAFAAYQDIYRQNRRIYARLNGAG